MWGLSFDSECPRHGFAGGFHFRRYLRSSPETIRLFPGWRLPLLPPQFRFPFLSAYSQISLQSAEVVRVDNLGFRIF